MSTPAIRETGGKTLDIAWVREQFPSLNTEVSGQPGAFLDGPAGTQVPRQVMEAIQNYLMNANANTYGAFSTSRRTNEMILAVRAAMADFFNCAAEEVVFGQNMTTITMGLARSIGRELKAGDEIVVTTLDHDANVAPWRALEEKGVVVEQVDIREADCTGFGRLAKEDCRGENEIGGGGICVEHGGDDQSRGTDHEDGA